jgi:hypothetical protein
MLDRQLQSKVLTAIVKMTAALKVDADYVIFGHVHRLGPLPEDDPAAWAGAAGRPRLLNSGSWRYEPLLLNRARPGHRFWPGGAVIIEEGSVPYATALLDELAAPTPALSR